MFSYKSVNGTNNARPKESNKNGNLKKQQRFFTLKWTYFIILEISLFNENNSHNKIMQTQTFFWVKGTQIWPEKEANPLKG